MPKRQEKNNRGSLNIKQHWTIHINNENVHRFYEKIDMIIDEKHKRLEEISKFKFKNANGNYDIVPGNKLKDVPEVIHRSLINEYIGNIPEEEEEILKKVLDSDIYYDKVVDIKLVKPTNTYVYDLTVDKDLTFCMANAVMERDTFHHAGIGGKGTTTLGVPRMKELLSFSKNMKTPVMETFLEEKYRNNTSMANKIASYMKYTTMRDIRNKVEIYYDPNPFDKDGFMKTDNVYNVFYSHNPSKLSCQSDIRTLPWLIRIILNKEELMEKNITLLDIKSKFCNHWEKRYKESKGVRKEEKQLLEKIIQCSILSNNDNSKTPIIHIRFDMTEFDFSTIVGFLDVFIDNFKLKGVSNIDDIINVDTTSRLITYDNEDQDKKIETENVIYTKGINIVDIRYINGINLNRTICNDVTIIYEHFGIEAARMALLREVKGVFEGAGNTINFQHYSILIDIMTNNGTLISVDRHGLNKLDTDPLSRASFEKTVDQLLQAAVFGEIDSMNSVSSRIMGGLVIKGGTGAFDVILDSSLLEKSEYVEDIQQKYRKTFNELTTNVVVQDIIEQETFAQEGLFIPMD